MYATRFSQRTEHELSAQFTWLEPNKTKTKKHTAPNGNWIFACLSAAFATLKRASSEHSLCVCASAFKLHNKIVCHHYCYYRYIITDFCCLRSNEINLNWNDSINHTHTCLPRFNACHAVYALFRTFHSILLSLCESFAVCRHKGQTKEICTQRTPNPLASKHIIRFVHNLLARARTACPLTTLAWMW